MSSLVFILTVISVFEVAIVGSPAAFPTMPGYDGITVSEIQGRQGPAAPALIHQEAGGEMESSGHIFSRDNYKLTGVFDNYLR